MKTNKSIILLGLITLTAFSCKEASPEPEPTSLKVGLVAHIPLDGNADDISETGLIGTITGATVTKDRKGKAGGAFYFDGTNDFILYNQTDKLNFSGAKPYTLSAWVKPDALRESGSSLAISKFDGGVAASWYLGVTKDANIVSYRNVAPWSAAGLSTITVEKYVHLLATYDGTDLKLYVNGVLDGSKPFTTNPNDAKTPVMIGGSHSRGTPTPNFTGSVDEVRIYNRVLEASEIEWLAKN